MVDRILRLNHIVLVEVGDHASDEPVYISRAALEIENVGALVT